MSQRLNQIHNLLNAATERHPTDPRVIEAVNAVYSMLNDGNNNLRECLDPEFGVFWQAWARLACPNDEAALESALRELDAALTAAGDPMLAEVAGSAGDESKTAREIAVESTTPIDPVLTAWYALPPSVRTFAKLWAAYKAIQLIQGTRRG